MCRKFMSLVSFALVLGLVLPTVANGELLGWWKLDEGSGTAANDSSGKGNHGTIQNPSGGLGPGGSVWDTDPKFDVVLSFNGDETAGAYVDAGMIIPAMTLTNDFTWAFWAKQLGDGTGVNMTMLGNRYGASDQLQFSKFTPTNFEYYNNGNNSGFIPYTIPAGVWIHHAVVKRGASLTRYLNGVVSGSSTIDATLVAQPFYMGGDAASERWSGWLSDVRIYNHALTEAEVKQLALGAHSPDPPDGATGVTAPLLSWKAGDTAMWHDVYLGTNPAPGAAEYKGRQPLAWNMWYEAGGWISGQTYYWRIDEVEADGTTIHTGDVWSFTAAPLAAYNPDPPDGVKYVLTDKDLSWTPGATAVTHDVYFGTDETEVTNGTGGTFKGNQQDVVYAPGALAKGTTYYWRIDEVEEDKTTKHTGTVWSFETIVDIPISDPDLLGWWKLHEGYGAIAIDWSGHGNHGAINNPGAGLGPDASVWDTDVDQGMVASFNGDDTTGAYVDAGMIIPAMTLTNGFTWTFWAKQDGDGTGTLQVIVGNRYGGTASPLQFIKFTPTRFEYYNDDPNYTMAIDYDDLPGGIWLHHAVVKDGATLIYYRNGIRSATVTVTKTMDANPFFIGGDAGGERWRGWLSNVRIYDRALTPHEVKQTMRSDPLLAWNPRPANNSSPDIDGATPLGWSGGDNAAKHDVYFGTDEDAVEDADTTTTGIYRGRQDPNTYIPPEGIDFGQSYYWRIDEYNADATISEGKVWSFTVPDYLLVDDFEPYDDYCNRIFYTWPDGWGHNGDAACGVPPYGGNGTGSTVGYLGAPYAEQTIIHEGKQSMPMEYVNDGSTGKALYSETERTFDPPQDWTRYGAKSLTLWVRGYPASVGSFNYEPPGGIYTLTADGTDIWDVPDFSGAGAGNYHDEFHYAYKQLSGVATIVARVLSVQNTNEWAKAGLMIRETLDANSVHAVVVVTPSQGVALQYRPTTGAASVNVQVTGITAPRWVRLTRSGNTFTGEHSVDGATWETIGTQDIPMSANVYVGLALTSHSAGVPCTATFSNVTITGTVTGQWQSQDIGIASNDAERLYVALEDSTGRVRDVAHPDPNAAQLDTWQEWNIALADFAPVDVTKVKKIYIGVGNRNTPKLGGGGMLYIDDVRLYVPRCVPSMAKPAADFNSDCVVDCADLEVMANEWLVDANGLQADLNLDSNVDFKDYAGLADTWLDVLLWPWP